MSWSSRKRFVLVAALVCLTRLTSPAQMASSSLQDGFRNPPAGARPWVFWMWLRVQTTREAITADLEAMHSKGIEGAILYDSRVGGGMKAKANLLRLTQEIPLDEDEMRAVEDGIDGHERLIAKLVSCPTPGANDY